jgi:hypothetical protein
MIYHETLKRPIESFSIFPTCLEGNISSHSDITCCRAATDNAQEYTILGRKISSGQWREYTI